jgi:hypothetical protein
MDWQTLHHASGFLVDCTILIAAVVAAVKLQLFHLLARRWHSGVTFGHWRAADDSVIFSACFSLHNRGQRPLRLTHVEIRVFAPTYQPPLLVQVDDSRVLASRVIRPRDPQSDTIEIHSGERMLFQLECRLTGSEESVIVDAYYHWVGARIPGRNRGFHCFLPGSADLSRSGGSEPATRLSLDG